MHAICFGPSLGSFRRPLERCSEVLAARSAPQNATDIGRNVPWASQPTVPGELGRNFSARTQRILVGCLVERCSEVLAARSGPKTQPISVGMFHGLPSRPCRGTSEEIFQPEPGGILVGCLVPTLPARCHGEQHVEANVCLPFVCFAYKAAWRTLCSSL